MQADAMSSLGQLPMQDAEQNGEIHMKVMSLHWLFYYYYYYCHPLFLPKEARCVLQTSCIGYLLPYNCQNLHRRDVTWVATLELGQS